MSTRSRLAAKSAATPSPGANRAAHRSHASEATPTPLHSFDQVPIHPSRPRPSASGGRPLPHPLRSSFENLFGESLHTVRIHEDHAAARRARGHRARALTVGEDIHFARNRYRPDDTAGRRLLTHELAHVVQQRHPGAPSSVASAEAEAARAATRAGSATALPRMQERARATAGEPLCAKSKAREILEDELDDVFCGVDNAWPAIRTAPTAERDEIRNDQVMERNIRRRASEMDLLKTYLLLNFQTEDGFPPQFSGFIEATDKWGTDEARIYSILRGVTQAERTQMQKMPGFVEVIEDEMSGSELQEALRLLYEGEQRSGTGTSTMRTTTHLEVGKRYALDVGPRDGFDEVRRKLVQATEYHDQVAAIYDDTSLWAQFADEFDAEKVWYLRMIARYSNEFPVANTQTEPFAKTMWEAVKDRGTDEDKLIGALQDVNRATTFNSGGGGRALKSPPAAEVKDEPWFVPMLEAELSGDDLKSAMNAVSAARSPLGANRDALKDAIDHHRMADIRKILSEPTLTPADRDRLRNDPAILDEMGEELHGVQLCETTQLLKHGAAIPTLVRSFLAFLQTQPINVGGAETYLKGLTRVQQNDLMAEPGVYYMLTDAGLGAADSAKLLAAIRSHDSDWQIAGSEGTHVTQEEHLITTMPVSFTGSEARIVARMNLDTSFLPRESGKPAKVPSGKVEDWTRAIDKVWNNKYRVRSGGRRLALIFDAYFAAGLSPKDVDVHVHPGEGRAGTFEPRPGAPGSMDLFLDGEDETVAHEFGHVLGNPDEYALTAASYQSVTGTPGPTPQARGGQTVSGEMGRHTASNAIEVRHVMPAVEIVNAVRDPAAYPAPFVPERI